MCFSIYITTKPCYHGNRKFIIVKKKAKEKVSQEKKPEEGMRRISKDQVQYYRIAILAIITELILLPVAV